MSIPVQLFDPHRVVTNAQLFSKDIDADRWVMFHGTSGFNAESIEREGFSQQPGMVSLEQMHRVANLYETMKWAGENGGGYAVLNPFSISHDVREGGGTNLFFAETSLRALLYATHDFCGGEKSRALRIAFADLDSYVNCLDVRERHERYMSKNFDTLTRLNAHPSMIDADRPVKVDLVWLRRELAKLADIRRFVDDTYHRYDHGVVYALRMTPGDLDRLCWNGSMGIATDTPISASKIVAKMAVPPDYKYNSFGQ